MKKAIVILALIEVICCAPTTTTTVYEENAVFSPEAFVPVCAGDDINLMSKFSGLNSELRESKIYKNGNGTTEDLMIKHDGQQPRALFDRVVVVSATQIYIKRATAEDSGPYKLHATFKDGTTGLHTFMVEVNLGCPDKASFWAPSIYWKQWRQGFDEEKALCPNEAIQLDIPSVLALRAVVPRADPPVLCTIYTDSTKEPVKSRDCSGMFSFESPKNVSFIVKLEHKVLRPESMTVIQVQASEPNRRIRGQTTAVKETVSTKGPSATTPATRITKKETSSVRSTSDHRQPGTDGKAESNRDLSTQSTIGHIANQPDRRQGFPLSMEQLFVGLVVMLVALLVLVLVLVAVVFALCRRRKLPVSLGQTKGSSEESRNPLTNLTVIGAPSCGNNNQEEDDKSLTSETTVLMREDAETSVAPAISVLTLYERSEQEAQRSQENSSATSSRCTSPTVKLDDIECTSTSSVVA